MKSSKERVINTLRLISLDMQKKYKNFDYIKLLQVAPVFYSLYKDGLISNTEDLKWINRDRVIISNHDYSSLAYAAMYFSGYPITIDDLKKFGEKDSKTPICFDSKKTNGIDMTIEDSTEAIPNAVGFNLAKRYNESLVNTKDYQIINYKTFVVCDLADLKCGKSLEALEIAKTQKLNDMIILCLYNKEVLEKQNKKEIENIEQLLETYNLDTVLIDSSNINSLSSAITKSRNSKFSTVILIDINNEVVNSKKVELEKEFDEKALELLRKEYEVCSVPFEVLKDDMDFFSNKRDKRIKEEIKYWQEDYDALKKTLSDEKIKLLEKIETGKNDILFDSTKFKIGDTYKENLIKSNESVLNILNKKYYNFVNVIKNSSTSNILVKDNYLDEKHPSGTNLDLNNNILCAGGILNGMAKEGINVVGTFNLTDSSSLISSIKTASFMNLPVAYTFINDSVFNSLEYNFNIPINELNNLRMIPNLIVYRPADVNEIFGAWENILLTRKTSCICLSNSSVPKLSNTNAKYVSYGAYIARKEQKKLNGVIISSGKELLTAIELAEFLTKKNIELRVVSMPSMDLLFNQKDNYEKLLFPEGVPVNVLEPTNSIIWYKFAKDNNNIFGIDNYSISGDLENKKDFYNYLEKDILIKVKNNVNLE